VHFFLPIWDGGLRLKGVIGWRSLRSAIFG
jgi:hypothetical protein